MVPIVDYDVKDILTEEERLEYLGESANKKTIEKLFKRKKEFKPIVQVPLSVAIPISITKDERAKITKELEETRNSGEKITASSFIRKKATSEIDLVLWTERAREGLRELSNPKYNKPALLKSKKKLFLKIEKAEDRETELMLKKRLKDIDNHLEALSKPTAKKDFKLSTRTTFEEANFIRWRAAKLNLSTAEYVRLVLFDYLPFSEADSHMSLDARKRFYLSILAVSNKGWGTHPNAENCSGCTRYKKEIKAMREKMRR